MPNLQLKSIECHETESISGADKTYIRVDGNKVWGIDRMNNGDARDLRGVVASPFQQRAEITVWDADGGAPGDDDDQLGTHAATAWEAGQGGRTGIFKEDGAHYTVHYEVTA